MFYPGSLWLKRISKLLILCGIGANLFLNDLQNTLLDVGEEMIEHSQKLSDPTVSIAYVMEHSLIPAIAYIEESRLNGVISNYSIPSSSSMQDQVESAYQLKETLDKYAPLYKDLALFLKAVGAIFWLPIGVAALWIVIDIKKSKARYFDLAVLAGAVWFNLWSYNYLSTLIQV